MMKLKVMNNTKNQLDQWFFQECLEDINNTYIIIMVIKFWLIKAMLIMLITNSNHCINKLQLLNKERMNLQWKLAKKFNKKKKLILSSLPKVDLILLKL